MIGGRQINIGMASVPQIKHAKNVDIQGYESVVEVFTDAIYKKIGIYKHDKEGDEWEKLKMKDYIEQTVHFMKHIQALKPMKPIKRITLWPDAVEMPPFYEGICSELQTTLVKEHYPRMFKAIDKGAVYSHWGLTQVKECVLYTMEFFQKKGLFNPVDDVLKTKEVGKWVDESNKYYEKNKEKIEKENKAREKYFDNELKEMERLTEEIKTLGEK